MAKKPALVLYRMPDELTANDDLTVSFVLALNGVPLLRAYEVRPYTPWSPDDVLCPEDMHTLALSLEKALGIYCTWQDVRGTRKATRIKVPGLKLVTQ